MTSRYSCASSPDVSCICNVLLIPPFGRRFATLLFVHRAPWAVQLTCDHVYPSEFIPLMNVLTCAASDKTLLICLSTSFFSACSSSLLWTRWGSTLTWPLMESRPERQMWSFAPMRMPCQPCPKTRITCVCFLHLCFLMFHCVSCPPAADTRRRSEPSWAWKVWGARSTNLWLQDFNLNALLSFHKRTSATRFSLLLDKELYEHE